MNSDTANKLIELNREFYTRFGAEFSSTRRRLQPGVKKILDSLRGNEWILDLGCGNGELARELSRRNFGGTYLGLDFSPPLLSAAAAPHTFPVQFQQADLTSNWLAQISNAKFHVIFAFAVLHHIPSAEMRLQILRNVKNALAPGGKFIHSNWQFLNSAKLRARIQAWSKASLRPEDVDEGDYLLDWKSGGTGLRYAHHFSSGELSALAHQTGMRVSASFVSDGAEGNLGLYQVWEMG